VKRTRRKMLIRTTDGDQWTENKCCTTEHAERELLLFKNALLKGLRLLWAFLEFRHELTHVGTHPARHALEAMRPRSPLLECVRLLPPFLSDLLTPEQSTEIRMFV
jgi:hypothetical protein